MLHVAAITSDRDAALGGLHRIGIEIGILGEIHQLTVIFQTLCAFQMENINGEANFKTVKIAKGAKLFNDLDSVVTDFAPVFIT